MLQTKVLAMKAKEPVRIGPKAPNQIVSGPVDARQIADDRKFAKSYIKSETVKKRTYNGK